MTWTTEQINAINSDPVLSRLGVAGLDLLLSEEERFVVQQHLTLLACQRRRIAIENAGGSMP